jgi:hypothetical protein
MEEPLDQIRSPRDGATQRPMWAAVALSVLVHAALLWGFPKMRLPSLAQPEWNDPNRSLSVRLVPLAQPPAPPSFAQRLRSPPAPRAQKPEAVRPPLPPPVVALKPPTRDTPAPARVGQGGDLSSYIEAKRRARALAEAPPAVPAAIAPPAPPVEDENARRERVAAANLALPSATAFGYDPRKRGGAFQIQRVGLDDAEFVFYGWDREARRNLARLVEVRRGESSDIRIAVVRRMIAIIRDYEAGDFLWESSRLGRSITLSARLRDNAGLEEFMMQEFFSESRAVR